MILTEKNERDIKQEFLDLIYKYKGCSMTEFTIFHMNIEFEYFFMNNDLKDLKYHIEVLKETKTIKFIPERMIDKLTIRGLLSL